MPEAVDLIRHAGPRPSVSAVTAAEVFAGARSTTEQRRIEGLFAQLTVYSVDLEVARLGAARTTVAAARATASRSRTP